jgi:hypothetical protein
VPGEVTTGQGQAATVIVLYNKQSSTSQRPAWHQIANPSYIRIELELVKTAQPLLPHHLHPCLVTVLPEFEATFSQAPSARTIRRRSSAINVPNHIYSTQTQRPPELEKKAPGRSKKITSIVATESHTLLRRRSDPIRLLRLVGGFQYVYQVSNFFTKLTCSEKYTHLAPFLSDPFLALTEVRR